MPASRRKPRSDGQAEFILTILLAGTLWAHKVVIEQAINISKYIAIPVILVTFSLFTYRFVKKRSYTRKSYDISYIDGMTGLEFEKFVARQLKHQGYRNVRLTEKYDYGIDIVAVKDGITWGIQVKRYSGLVKADAVRQVVTALNHYNCDRAMVITNGHFSSVARNLASSNGCVLVDRTTLTSLLFT